MNEQSEQRQVEVSSAWLMTLRLTAMMPTEHHWAQMRRRHEVNKRFQTGLHSLKSSWKWRMVPGKLGVFSTSCEAGVFCFLCVAHGHGDMVTSQATRKQLGWNYGEFEVQIWW